MAFLALNIWTGSPLLALWIGSQVQGEESQASMAAFAAVIGCLAVFSIGLYQALKYVMHAYQETTGTLPTVRTTRPGCAACAASGRSTAGPTSAAPSGSSWSRCIIAAAVVRGWFFFFSGSSDRRRRRALDSRYAPVAQLDRAAAF